MKNQSLKTLFVRLALCSSFLFLTSCKTFGTHPETYQSNGSVDLTEDTAETYYDDDDTPVYGDSIIDTVCEKALEIETQIMDFHNQLAEKYGSSWGFMNRDIETPYEAFIEILQKVQKTENFDHLALAFYTFETIYGEALEENLLEESPNFYDYMAELDAGLQNFAKSQELPPPNILSHERREYETQKALERQMHGLNTESCRDLMQRFRSHFMSFAPQEERDRITEHRIDENPSDIKMPNIRDILRWPQTMFTDEQINNLNGEIFETMATSIDGGYIHYKIAKAEAAKALKEEIKRLGERFDENRLEELKRQTPAPI